MRVLYAGKVNRIRTALDCHAFVEQHTNARRFQIGNHRNAIVIPKHGVNVGMQRFPQARDAFEAGFEIAVRSSPIVLCQHTKIIL
jgi:hypothetical protein